eukprot:10028564-Karenia_brevis.AAC.1
MLFPLCVRASERSCVCLRDDVVSEAGQKSFNSAPFWAPAARPSRSRLIPGANGRASRLIPGANGRATFAGPPKPLHHPQGGLIGAFVD